MTLRVVVVGISHWHAPRYLEALRTHDAKVVAVSDHDPAVARRRAQEFGCGGYVDTDAMLATMRPDFAIVLPRHDRAADEIAIVAQRRVAALVEKPMGISAAEAERAAVAMTQAGVFAAACLPNRYLSFWQAVDELQRDGRLGRPVHATFRIVNGPPQRYRESGVPWMLDPATAGGGALRNLGVHGADATLALAGGAVTVRGAALARRAHALPIEDYALAALASADDFVSTIEVGYTHAGAASSDQEWRLAATGAYIVDANGTLAVTTADGKTTTSPARRAADVYRLMFDDALERFRAGRPPLVGLDATARAVAVLDAIYHAGKDREQG